MPDTFTPNLNMTQPEVGASDDSWGTKLNADLAALDALFSTTGTGVVVRHDANDNAATVGVTVSKAAGNGRWVQFLTAGVARWFAGANTVAEGGSNAGSDWNLQRYSDAGALLGTSIAVARATGKVTFETTPQVGANAVFHAGNAGQLSPGVGEIRMWGGSSDPAGGFWMIADGRALDRTTYAGLFALYGTTYGAGNGATTFNIPSMGERVPMGHVSAKNLIQQYDCTVLGNAIGESTHTLVNGELPAITPTFTGNALPPHSHTEGFNTTSLSGAGEAAVFPQNGSQFTNTTSAVSAGTPSGTISSFGNNQAHNNVQNGLVLNFIVRVL